MVKSIQPIRCKVPRHIGGGEEVSQFGGLMKTNPAGGDGGIVAPVHFDLAAVWIEHLPVEIVRQSFARSWLISELQPARFDL
jgi:hypothetical protein